MATEKPKEKRDAIGGRHSTRSVAGRIERHRRHDNCIMSKIPKSLKSKKPYLSGRIVINLIFKNIKKKK